MCHIGTELPHQKLGRPKAMCQQVQKDGNENDRNNYCDWSAPLKGTTQFLCFKEFHEEELSIFCKNVAQKNTPHRAYKKHRQDTADIDLASLVDFMLSCTRLASFHENPVDTEGITQ